MSELKYEVEYKKFNISNEHFYVKENYTIFLDDKKYEIKADKSITTYELYCLTVFKNEIRLNPLCSGEQFYERAVELKIDRHLKEV